jgi:N-acetylglucosamine kinase-like BadF-type ATPase
MNVLGLDAGGTKTVCLLADEHGRILSEARGAGANLQSAGELEVEKVLHHVMESALGDRLTRPEAICLGIAGVDREDDARVVRAIMRRIAPGSRVIVVNDALVALVAGAGSDPGIVVMSGTGSIAYGRNGRSVAARAGGWGHVIGDEGSGYWIGRHAIIAVVRAADGRGPRTRLTEDVLAHFRVADAAALVHIVYDREAPRTSIATVAPVVQRARDSGDAVAAQILERAAEELTAAASSVAARLDMRGDEFPFVLAGGAFRAVPWLVGELQRRLIEVAPRCEVRLLNVEPAVGAVALAIAEARGGANLPQYAGMDRMPRGAP